MNTLKHKVTGGFFAFLFFAIASGQAQIEVPAKDIKDGYFEFEAPGEQLENVSGAMLSAENIGYTAWVFPDGPLMGKALHYLYADGNSGADTASIVLKWDFSKSNHLVTEVEIPNNRLYFQFELNADKEDATAVISYSTDGEHWTEFTEFAPKISELNAERPVEVQDLPLNVTLDKPAKAFFYRVEFRTKGKLFGQAFQWERMGNEPEYMRPGSFNARFKVILGR